MISLCIIVPCYNEAEALPITATKLIEKVNSLISSEHLNEASKIIFVDDGSVDDTWQVIKKLHETNSCISGVKLSRNFGHQNALLAGISVAHNEKYDATITIDADLQDDVDVIDQMVELYMQGTEILYGVRSDRSSDSTFKRSSAQMYYKIMKALGVELIYDHADYRLLGSKAMQALTLYKEKNVFLRGIVPKLGYDAKTVFYKRSPRIAGETKYPLRKMLSFAFEGLTSFSVHPLRFVMNLGIIMMVVSLLMMIYFLVRHFSGNTIPGWTSIAISLWLIGGLQIAAIGLVGEYIGKIYLETKNRPRFIIEEYKSDRS